MVNLSNVGNIYLVIFWVAGERVINQRAGPLQTKENKRSKFSGVVARRLNFALQKMMASWNRKVAISLVSNGGQRPDKCNHAHTQTTSG